MIKMRQLLGKVLLSSFAVSVAAGGLQLVVPAGTVYAACGAGQVQQSDGSCRTLSGPVNSVCQGVNGASGTTDCGSDKGSNQLPSLVRNVINILLFVIGLISVIMIIVGGIRYVVSNGDQSAITSAKNTILYAIIGVIVAILAYSIVNFVVGSL